jgi:hypothetical protein
MAHFKRDDNMPLSGEEKRRLKRQTPVEKVPEELAALEESGPPCKTVKFIDREAVRQLDIPATLEGYSPPWLGVSFAPQRAPTPRPPIVTYRGERLDPLVIHQPDDRRTYSDLTYPWVCVCRITRPDGRRGSGVLIGARRADGKPRRAVEHQRGGTDRSPLRRQLGPGDRLYRSRLCLHANHRRSDFLHGR